VTAVAAYRTVPAPAAELAPLCADLEARAFDVVTFFAPSQVDAVLDALGAGGPPILARATMIVAIGPTTADALKARGVRVDLVPPTPSAEALADLIVRWLRPEVP
jgi:uroporphyrinogen-III synthase